MKIGDKVRVINKDDECYGKIGKIYDKSTIYNWIVCFSKDNSDFFNTKDLQLIKPVGCVSKKKPSTGKWKYSRKQIMKRLEAENYMWSDLVHDLLLVKSTKSSIKNITGKEGSVLKKPVSSTLNSRPTLKPIDKIGETSVIYEPNKNLTILRLWAKQREIIDRINLLSEKI